MRFPAPRLLAPLAVLFALSVHPAAAQTRRSGPDDALYRTVAALDTALFQAYNTCDPDAFAKLVAEDVEFYHDQSGVARGRASLVESLERNICGKTRRDLVPGTLEVHPMDGYGALQIGTHRFCDVAAARCDATSGGIARFIHLWRQSDGVWQLTRVISYDHAPAAP